MNSTLPATIPANNLDYIPCSMVEPNTANRCSNPEDANWAAPGVYFNWAWDGYLFGATVTRPGRNRGRWIDKTLSYGFGRVKGMLPPNTFGGYPGEGFYSTAYNAGYGGWGLASNNYRDQGILSLRVHDQQRPERAVLLVGGLTAPSTTTPWIGNHPASGGGSSPHAWGIAMGDLACSTRSSSQRTDGSLIVGRGVPGQLGRVRPPDRRLQLPHHRRSPDRRDDHRARETRSRSS